MKQNLKPLSNLTIILENIRSIYNVGSIFRTAEAFGVSQIVLVGCSGILIPNNYKDKRPVVLNYKLSKTALETEKIIPFKHFWSIKKAVKNLRDTNSHLKIVALEQSTKSKSIFSFKYNNFPLAIIVGNEKSGVSKEGLSLADKIIEIPMLGKHKSLNVSVATSIFLFNILYQATNSPDQF